MSTAASPTARPPAVLYDIDWKTYTRILRVFEGRRRVRLTYDRGRLEIQNERLWDHERQACFASSIVHVLTEELNLPCRLGGSVTLRLRRKQRGLEPDNCYWINNAPLVLGKSELDLRIDPPPDLAIEIDVTSSSIDRMSIYAALSVPEIWRLSTGGIAFYVLDSGAYKIRPNSLSFPQLASTDLTPFLAQWGQSDDTAIVRQFREWVKQQLLSRPKPSTPPSP